MQKHSLPWLDGHKLFQWHRIALRSVRTLLPERTMRLKRLTLFQVRVLLLPGAYEAPLPFFYVYKATISSAFLDKFDSPSRCSLCDPIEIGYYKLHTKKPAQLVRQLPLALGLVDDKSGSEEECQKLLTELGMEYLKTRAWRMG